MPAAACIVAIAVLAAVSACRPRSCGHVCSHRAGEPQMDSAHARARATVGVLLHALQQPSPTLTYASAQVRVSGRTLGEHIWLDSLHYDGRELVGTLDEDATGLPDFRKGMGVRVPPAQVSDWMIIDHGRVCGAFSLRLEWPRMEDAEKEQFLRYYHVTRLPPGDQVCDAEERVRP